MEEQYKNRLDKFKNVLKQIGTESTIQLMGGWDNFTRLFNIKSPMDFLHLFDDLEQVQSEVNENCTLFPHKKNENLMIYDRKNECVYINYDEIWSFLSGKFELNYDEIKLLTQEWLGKVYDLRGVTTTTYDKMIFQSWERFTI